MRKLTVLLIPDADSTTKQWTLPCFIIKLAVLAGFLFVGILGFLTLDYIELIKMRSSYSALTAENEGLKGEARILMSNFDQVRDSLNQVQDYTRKLMELTNVQVKRVAKKTGVGSAIGPLNPEEYKIATEQAKENANSNYYMPLGISMDKLTLKTTFDSLYDIGRDAETQAVELQRILSTLSQQKSLLAATPSISPVSGWIASGFGYRVSPFTAQRTMHQGLDIAAPIGTPIYAPADGVVIYSGVKEGFGNFIMIAHGYGVVTRYGHNSQNLVQPGQKVNRGDQIGTVGATGRTTGPHLHYEVVLNGKNVNPSKFILDMSSVDDIFASN